MAITCHPANKEAWLAVANERATDAKRLQEKAREVAAVYMAGYAVESALKAYCSHCGISYKGSGRAGHNLNALWKLAGFQLRDVADPNGTHTFFIREWSTDLRYHDQYDFPISTDQLVKGAVTLMQLIQSRIKRPYRRSR
jgi:HEPN domain-containing protein